MKFFFKHIIVGFLIFTTCVIALIYGFLLNKNLSGNVLRFEWPLILTERFFVQNEFRYLDHSFIIGRDSIEVLIEINGSKIQFPPSKVELWSFEHHPTFFQIVFEVDSAHDKILLNNLKEPVSSILHSPNDGFENIEQYFHTKDRKFVVVRTQLLGPSRNRP